LKCEKNSGNQKGEVREIPKGKPPSPGKRQGKIEEKRLAKCSEKGQKKEEAEKTKHLIQKNGKQDPRPKKNAERK